ncbi:hypothetical protein F4553_007222 [Allocatelliglobosispora scoriae]|uniref:Uncharacterized protein n=1 Tax=Allocatelliglobosispora scoriae TaxID=643052 RepID=A0A841C207_9ACTN|nr:hypothetical protein [Allocatelliglobosispora scoriae]MBB5873788.1 hypothetical protein [Allocatelliglobosispora scoriae]
MIRRALMVLTLLAATLVGTAAPARAAVAPVDLFRYGSFADDFTGSSNTDPLYGLNVGLDTRQTGTSGPVSYTRVSGLWNTGVPPKPWYAQVNQPSHPDRLSFHLGTSAIMLGAPAVADASGQFTVSALIDPVAGSTAGADWGSLVLSRSRLSWGYPTNADVDLGLTVSSAGALAVYRRAAQPIFTGSVAPAAAYQVSLTVAPLAATLTVNGQVFSVPVPAGQHRWPSLAYLYLGAYLSGGSAVTTFDTLRVSRVDTSIAASPELFAETFDGADSGTDYGLNQGLRARQPGVVANRYTRTSGLWNSSTPPQPWLSQVNHLVNPDRLSFHLAPSAVRLDKPLATALDGVAAVGATLDPVVGDTAGTDWLSLMLSPSATGNGYVTDADVDLGLVLRSSGRLQLYRRGAPTFTTEPAVAPAADGSFRVGLTVAGREVALVVNGQNFFLTLGYDLGVQEYVSLGSYITAPGPVSTVDELRLSKLGGLNHYGYFDVMDPADHADHSPEVAGYTNLNIYLEDVAQGYLDYCRPHSCAVDTQWQTFLPGSGGVWSPRGDAPGQLGRLRAQIGSNIDKIGSIYLIDEPYLKGVLQADLQNAVSQIRAVFQGAVLTLTLFGRDATLGNPAQPPVTGVDRVGFDMYCASAADLTSSITWLGTNLPNAAQQIFLVPESAPQECAGATDATIAAKQQTFLNLAAANRRITMLINFGWWLGPYPRAEDHPFTNLPQTSAKQQAIGTSILGLT